MLTHYQLVLVVVAVIFGLAAITRGVRWVSTNQPKHLVQTIVLALLAFSPWLVILFVI